jgi:hypothetical protein
MNSNKLFFRARESSRQTSDSVYDFRDESDDDSLMIDELPKKRRHTLESFSSLKLPSKLYLRFVQIISAVFFVLSFC